MGAEATLYLLERGVRVTGTDGWSWDAPFIHTAKRYAETHDPSIIWEGHKAGRHIGYCHIEKLQQSRGAALDGIHGGVLSGQDRARLGRLDAGGGDHRTRERANWGTAPRLSHFRSRGFGLNRRKSRL